MRLPKAGVEDGSVEESASFSIPGEAIVGGFMGGFTEVGVVGAVPELVVCTEGAGTGSSSESLSSAQLFLPRPEEIVLGIGAGVGVWGMEGMGVGVVLRLRFGVGSRTGTGKGEGVACDDSGREDKSLGSRGVKDDFLLVRFSTEDWVLEEDLFPFLNGWGEEFGRVERPVESDR